MCPHRLNPSDVSQASMFYPINIKDIDFYDHNPRKSHEPAQYEELKESIKHKGVLQPVHVTKRSGATKYILSKGGNTRLKIFLELFQETGDAKFSSIPCIYQPFTSELDLFVGHLIENKKRSEMCFWDRASAYSRLRDDVQAGYSKSLSLREFADQFAQIGCAFYTIIS